MDRPSTLSSKYYVVLVVAVICFYYVITCSSTSSYSVEQVNTILQDKDHGATTIRKQELSSHRLSPPFLAPHTSKLQNWHIDGNTIIQKHDFIRLTTDNPHLAGSIFSKKTLGSESFEMELTFHIHTKKRLAADGMVIWFLDKVPPIGDVFGATNYFDGLGIFVDTYGNSNMGRFPFVYAMRGDGKTFYDKDKDGKDLNLPGCRLPSALNPKSGSTKARIVYLTGGYFSIDFSVDNKPGEWKNCITLTDMNLPKNSYLGFSAETGELTENVDILECVIYELFKPDGTSIESIQQLEDLIEREIENPLEGSDKNGKESNVRPKRKRKSLMRLKKAEKKIKEKEKQMRKEKYGHEDIHIYHYVFYKIVNFFKVILLTFIVILLLWALFIIYRIVRSARPVQKSVGILD